MKHLFLMICLTPLFAAAQDDVAFRELRKRYSQFKSYASGVECKLNLSDSKKVSLKGRICFSGKDKWLVELYSTKANKLLYYHISDGKHQWQLTGRKKQLILKTPVGKRTDRPKFAFFPDLAKIDLSTLKAIGSRTSEEVRYIVSMKGENASKLSLWVDKNKSVIKKMALLDQTGKTKFTATFSDITVDKEPHDTVFRFANRFGLSVMNTTEEKK